MRLIDADRFLEILKREEAHHSDLPQRADGVRDAIMDVISAPTVDAVDVVRCKYCKWYGYYSCEMGGNNWMRDGNGFCDRGERKDGDQNG